MKRYSIKKDKRIIFVLTAAVISIVLTAFVMTFFRRQESSLRENILSMNSDMQQSQISAALASGYNSAEELKNSLLKLDESSSYWFVYSSDGAVLEKNEEQTQALKGMTLENIREYYERKGGEGLDGLFSYIDGGKSFSAVVVKDKQTGTELISAQFVTIGGQTYCAGRSVKCSYIYSSARISEHILRLRIVSGAVCAVIIVLSVLSAAVICRKSERIAALKAEGEEKSRKIQQLCDREALDGEEQTDALTGLFSRSFFDAIIKKLSERRAENVRFVLLRITDLYGICYLKGHEAADGIAAAAAREFSDCFKDCACARLSYDTFAAVLAGGHSEDKTSELEKMLRRNCPEAEFSVKISDSGKSAEVLAKALSELNGHTGANKKGRAVSEVL